MTRSRFLIYTGILAIVWAVVDLGSKHWIQYHLATPDHLLPINITQDLNNHTLCDAAKKLYDIKDCKEIDKMVFLVDGPVVVDKNTLMEQLLTDYSYLFAFKDADTHKFAVRVPLVDRETNKKFKTLYEALKIVGFSDSEISRIIRKGIYGLKRGTPPARTSQIVHSGELYLIANRIITIIPGHLDLSYVENPAGAWGALGSLPRHIRKIVFYGVTILALGVILYLIVYPPAYSWWIIIALSGILGGAIGNLVDRFSMGSVVDFIHMYWGRLNWPNYNVADIGITIGLVILVGFSFFGSKKEKKSQ